MRDLVNGSQYLAHTYTHLLPNSRDHRSLTTAVRSIRSYTQRSAAFLLQHSVRSLQEKLLFAGAPGAAGQHMRPLYRALQRCAADSDAVVGHLGACGLCSIDELMRSQLFPKVRSLVKKQA